MPLLNRPLKKPLASLWYSSLGAVALSLFILVLGLFLILGAAGNCEGDGCGLLSFSVLLPLMSIVILMILIYPILSWYLFSYELTERTITVNSGILFRQYETIDFGRIQVVDNERGPLLWFFGLTEVRIWTASSDQLTFEIGSKSAQIRPRPDTSLILTASDAQALKDFIMRSKTPTSGGL